MENLNLSFKGQNKIQIVFNCRVIYESHHFQGYTQNNKLHAHAFYK